MLKLGRVTNVKMFLLVLVYVFNIDLFGFSAAILEKALLHNESRNNKNHFKLIHNDMKGVSARVYSTN